VSTLLLLAVAIAGAILLRHSVVPWLLFGAVLSYFATLVLVPYYTDMRLFLPSLIFLVGGAMYAASDAFRHFRHPGHTSLIPDR